MTDHKLAMLVSVAGWLHFLQIPAMAFFQRHVLEFQAQLAKLSSLSQRVARVVGGGIMLAVLGTGAVVVLAPDELARGGTLARGLLGFLGVFWGYRACGQLWYARVWPHSPAGAWTHALLVLIFSTQAGIYLFACTQAATVPGLASW